MKPNQSLLFIEVDTASKEVEQFTGGELLAGDRLVVRTPISCLRAGLVIPCSTEGENYPQVHWKVHSMGPGTQTGILERLRYEICSRCEKGKWTKNGGIRGQLSFASEKKYPVGSWEGYWEISTPKPSKERMQIPHTFLQMPKDQE